MLEAVMKCIGEAAAQGRDKACQ
uniref:Uncharacterized protein n=1 Tax=Ralstonia solanacearum TaxID=305 RepID=A0A0S4UL24_RALSL|nr:protein of unknown function [Ralstonia solanacearum]CUV32517.1 protein of unknown function [Ralstonia solanacearum]CUV60722.1 protein of unknown function [Ralstonia solanacearum]